MIYFSDISFTAKCRDDKGVLEAGHIWRYNPATDMTSIFAAMKKVEDFVGESVPVVSAKDHIKLVGVIPEGNIFKAYSDAIGEIREEEYGDS